MSVSTTSLATVTPDLIGSPFPDLSLFARGQEMDSRLRGNDDIVEVCQIAIAFPRHPELVSGSISHFVARHQKASWMLKQVQHDGSFI